MQTCQESLVSAHSAQSFAYALDLNASYDLKSLSVAPMVLRTCCHIRINGLCVQLPQFWQKRLTGTPSAARTDDSPVH